MTVISTERRARCVGLALLLLAASIGCSPDTEEEGPAAAASWSVTAWGERFEVFPEVDPLIAGDTAVAHTHVTRLDGFTPLVDGRVEIALVSAGGEQVFASEVPTRPGIFAVEIEPAASGDFDLLFRIEDAEGIEEIRGGKVRVGTDAEPGGIVVAPAPRGGRDGGEPLAFLKEEQWRSDFATGWVRSGSLARSATGLARVRPPAGGESTVTAPVDGVVRPPSPPRPWPYVGLRVQRGTSLFRIDPMVSPERSLATLEAELSTLEAELETARARQERLEELLSLDATSRREVEEARVRVETLEARRRAATRDLDSARSSRQGGDPGGTGALSLQAPLSGEIAQVSVTPGVTVTAGEPLARVVRTDLVWIEVALSPSDASRIAGEGVEQLVLTHPEREPERIESDLRLVSVAPELSPRTGTVTVIVETPHRESLRLGTALEAQLLSDVRRDGIVIPASALVDDGGVPVVYLQLSGESFVRQEIEVLERQGDRLLVERLIPGQRLVRRGGEAIRRSSLMASGEAHGHVH